MAASSSPDLDLKRSAGGYLFVEGARQHNLKNISVRIPKGELVVITGPSGSGKSSLAFDTIFAEGQRRYLQSLSSYARQFIDQLDKPDVDSIEGLAPAIAIEQRTVSSTPRSTVGTATELQDYLRVLFATLGVPHHPLTGKPLTKLSAQDIVERILEQPAGTNFSILAPILRDAKGDIRPVVERLMREGFVRVRLNGELLPIGDVKRPPRGTRHNLDVVIDRLSCDEGFRSRLSDAVELALRIGNGILSVAWADGTRPEWTLSNRPFDPETGYRFQDLTPQHFSFNHPLGACPVCHGLGTRMLPDPELVVQETSLSLEDGAIAPWKRAPKRLAVYYRLLLRDLARASGAPTNLPWKDLPDSFKQLVLYGSGDSQIEFTRVRSGRTETYSQTFDGVLAQIQNLYETSRSNLTRLRLQAYMAPHACPGCQGARLRPETLSVFLFSNLGRHHIHSLTSLPVKDALAFVENLTIGETKTRALEDLIGETRGRLGFLANMGLGYLNLNREMSTLSGGENQRVRLATQIGAGLTGVLYVLDEPSIGLHQRDNRRLLSMLKALRDQDNSVLVVEHDEEAIWEADYVFDMGPGAGAKGGTVVASGTPAEISANPVSPTGRYLSNTARIHLPTRRMQPLQGAISVRGARENNLKNISVDFPVGCFTCVTGVSGSGKSTLVNDVLSRALFRHYYKARDKPGAHGSIGGFDKIDRVATVDQNPIGRTPRSNPATYVGAFDPIRDLYARLPAARVRGYGKARFSFNVPGGRCEQCKGDGCLKLEMRLLPDVFVTCEACKGKRFNRETLEITYKSLNIADVLALSVSEALSLFANVRQIAERLAVLESVGLGYLQLGQPATTLSGGEAQRVKLAAELSRKNAKRTCFILDEPTTGLHFQDIEMLLEVMFRLRDAGGTLIVVEHHLDVIKCADYVIDLGPEGGEDGGEIVVAGTPEEVARHPSSHTGRFLRPKLETAAQQFIHNNE